MGRINLNHWKGINTLVSDNVADVSEFEMAENARSEKLGTIEKRKGYRRLGDDVTSTANYGLFFFDDANSLSTGFYRISTISASTSVYYLNTSSAWTIFPNGNGVNVNPSIHSFVEAEGCLFMVNGTTVNRYIDTTGIAIITSSTSTGHLYNSPIAFKINYYKDRLYVGDYLINGFGTTRYKNSVMMSSTPLGIVALVDGDHNASVTSLKVTDVKYIFSTDSLDLYRGGTKIGDITVTAKNADTNTLTISAFGTNIKSSDELWVDGTYTGARVFRWASIAESGTDVKQYDTFKLSGGDNSPLTILTNVGDVMMIANKYNMAIWNDYSLQNLDIGIGCVSSQGWVKAMGTLYFLGYNGIYSTTGGAPKLISTKIQRLFDGATKAGLEAGAMGKKGLSIFCSLGDVTLYNSDGSTDRTLSDVVVEYNLQTEYWFVHTGIDAKFFSNYSTSTDIERLEYAGSDGHVFELLYGSSDNNSVEIPFRADSFPITLNKEFENLSYPKQIIIEIKAGSAIQCFVSLDEGDWFEIQGEARKGCSIMYVTAQDGSKGPVRARKIAVSIRDYSKTFCKIGRVGIVYSETSEEESFRDQHKN